MPQDRAVAAHGLLEGGSAYSDLFSQYLSNGSDNPGFSRHQLDALHRRWTEGPDVPGLWTLGLLC